MFDDAVACHHCGFGFLFELQEDYYPAPGTGFVVADQQGRILALGRGVFELTGWSETDFIGTLTRTSLQGPDDVPTLKALQREYRLMPLSEFAGTKPPQPAPRSPWSSSSSRAAWSTCRSRRSPGC